MTSNTKPIAQLSEHADAVALHEMLGFDATHPVDEAQIARRMKDICEERTALLADNERLARDVDKLVSYLDQLQHDIIGIEQSRAWRIGYKLMGYAKAALGRKPGRYAFISIHRVLTIYHHWKKSRG